MCIIWRLILILFNNNDNLIRNWNNFLSSKLIIELLVIGFLLRHVFLLLFDISEQLHSALPYRVIIRSHTVGKKPVTSDNHLANNQESILYKQKNRSHLCHFHYRISCGSRYRCIFIGFIYVPRLLESINGNWVKFTSTDSFPNLSHLQVKYFLMGLQLRWTLSQQKKNPQIGSEITE